MRVIPLPVKGRIWVPTPVQVPPPLLQALGNAAGGMTGFVGLGYYKGQEEIVRVWEVLCTEAQLTAVGSAMLAIRDWLLKEGKQESVLLELDDEVYLSYAE